MVILRAFTILAILFFAASVSAQDTMHEYRINKVQATCIPVDYCRRFDEQLSRFANHNFTLIQLRREISFLALDDSLQSIEFNISESAEEQVLTLTLKKKKIVTSIEIKGVSSDIALKINSYVPWRKGDFYDIATKDEAIAKIQKALNDMGNFDTTVNISLTELGPDQVSVLLNITIKKQLLINKVVFYDSTGSIWNADESRQLTSFFSDLSKSLWNKGEISLQVDRLREYLSTEGYLLVDIKLMPPIIWGNKVQLNIMINKGPRFIISCFGNKVVDCRVIKKTIKKEIVRQHGLSNKEDCSKEIIKIYDSNQIYNSKVSIRAYEWSKGSELYIFADINEGIKRSLNSVVFIGNNFLSSKDLKKEFYSRGSVLTSNQFFDSRYAENFASSVKEKYFKSGFGLIKIMHSSSLKDDAGKLVNLMYEFQEGPQAIVKEIAINYTGEDLKGLLDSLENKVDSPLNIIALEDDRDRALDYLRNKGFYFVKFNNRMEDFVSYDSSFKRATLNYDLNLGKKAVYAGFTVSGNNVTKNRAVMREISLTDGDIIVPSKIKKITDRLRNTRLFSEVSIVPTVVDDSKEDIVPVLLRIKVKEVDFGSIDFAPGYRTDIGAKMSTSISYNNLNGMNRTVGAKAQVNQRLDWDNLDQTRRDAKQRLTEYDLSGKFSEPYFFGKKLGLENVASTSRKRYYSFDANVFRISSSLSKSYEEMDLLPGTLTYSLKYQFETISQYNATQSLDNGEFWIGGITPGISYDLRDSSAVPRKGAMFGLTWEFANPYWGSMKKPNTEVNFYKLTSRNKFYIPIWDSTLSISLSGGVEKNMAPADPLPNGGYRGYIPQIKVFRLEGADLVRGYSEEELKKTPNGSEISKLAVTDMAYFINLKIEPRYYFSDQTAMGLFFDAGRVFVDQFTPFDLRTSVGLTFKLLTPVGSLDFDYGVKMKRETLPSGEKEKFGRFNLSIGYF